MGAAWKLPKGPGDTWIPDTTNGWANGKDLRFAGGTGLPDTEGIAGNQLTAHIRVEQGFRLVEVASDARLLGIGAGEALNAAAADRSTTVRSAYARLRMTCRRNPSRINGRSYGALLFTIRTCRPPAMVIAAVAQLVSALYDVARVWTPWITLPMIHWSVPVPSPLSLPV